MVTGIIKEKQDLTYLKWSHIRGSSGTAGTFLKSESSVGGIKKYYKLSNFDAAKGVIGHECINEIIVDRLLTILGIEHLSYELIYADIEIEGKIYTRTLRIAPLFDHGLSLLYSCMSDKEAQRFDVLEDRRCNNFIGGQSCYENLKLVNRTEKLLAGKINEGDNGYIFAGLEGIISDVFLDKIWEMIYKRYRIYESL